MFLFILSRHFGVAGRALRARWREFAGSWWCRGGLIGHLGFGIDEKAGGIYGLYSLTQMIFSHLKLNVALGDCGQNLCVYTIIALVCFGPRKQGL